jgi:hypothetical protein
VDKEFSKYKNKTTEIKRATGKKNIERLSFEKLEITFEFILLLVS